MAEVYIASSRGGVYRYNSTTQLATRLFDASQGVEDALVGVAGMTVKHPAFRVDSSETQIAVLQRIAGESFLRIYWPDGRLIVSYNLGIQQTLYGLAQWPRNAQLLVLAGASGFYFVDTTDGMVRYAPTSQSLRNGIAVEDATVSNPLTAVFLTGNINGEIVRWNLNRLYRSAQLSSVFARRLPKEVTGLAGVLEAQEFSILAGLPENGRTQFYRFTAGVPTTAAKKQRFSLCGMTIAAVGASAGLATNGGASSNPDPTTSVGIETRRYDASGNLVGGVLGVNFGAAAPGQISTTQCVSLKVNGAKEIANVRLGLVTCDNLPPSNIYMSQQPTFDSATVPATAFTATGSDASVAIDTRVGAGGVISESNYVYLAARATAGQVGAGCVLFRWYFDYDV